MTIAVKNLDIEMAQILHDLCQGVYLDGECYAFAMALHRNLGWQMLGLLHQNTIRHAVVRNPQNGALFDARGQITDSELGDPFGVPAPYHLKQLEELDLLLLRPVHERSIAQALDMAQRIWPDLPWKDSPLERACKFAQALEELCRQYNIWIRPTVPGAAPILYTGYGDETGYALFPVANGAICTINRTLP